MSSVGASPTARAARTAVTGGVLSFSGQLPPSRRSLAGTEGAPEQSPGGEKRVMIAAADRVLCLSW